MMVASFRDGERLVGLRILVVEDNFLVAISVKHMLEKLGCEVVGPTPSLEEGLTLVEAEQLDGAILDINIQGGSSVEIAESLTRRGCPFVFLTGYASPHALPEVLKPHTKLHKPIADHELELALVGFVGS